MNKKIALISSQLLHESIFCNDFFSKNTRFCNKLNTQNRPGNFHVSTLQYLFLREIGFRGPWTQQVLQTSDQN